MESRIGIGGDVNYGKHGAGYALQRQPDPRIAAHIEAALGDARTVLNVGAGTGSYESRNRLVLAIEPAAAMRAQRPRNLAPAIEGVAEYLPFDYDSFDASTAFITIHQWQELQQGLNEMRRVTRGPVVILTLDGEATEHFWLKEYAPELIAGDRRRFPAIATICEALGGRTEVRTIPVPLDCTDGFNEAFYGRPEKLLEPDVRRAQSGWTFLEPGVEYRSIENLRAELESGRWDEKFGELRSTPEYVGSLRLIVGYP